MTDEELAREEHAQAGYEGYAEYTGGKTFDGRNMPKWDELPPNIKKAWQAATAKILKRGLITALKEITRMVEEELKE